MKAKLLTAVVVALLLTRLLPIWTQIHAASCSNTAVGTFTCVQSTSVGDASSSTLTIATGSNVTAGNVLVGAVGWLSSTITLSSVAGCGGTYTIVDNPQTSDATSRGAGFYATGASGACTITATLSLAAVGELVVHEISGVDTANPVQTRHAGSAQQSPGTGANAVTVGPVTASGTDYIFGTVISLGASGAPTVGTGYTIREANGNAQGGISSEDKSASGSNTVTFTDFGAFDPNTTFIMSLKSSAAAASAPRLLLQNAGFLLLIPTHLWPH